MASIETSLGPYMARVHDEIATGELKMMRRYSLELDGVTFPTPEVERMLLLWEANAAQRRGAYVLNEDGSAVDPSDFEYDDARAMLRSNRVSIGNAEKLDTFIDLEKTARAASLALEDSRALGNTYNVEMLTRLIDMYKKVLQILLTLNKWERPWHTIVEEEFPGETMKFPMTVENMEVTAYPLVSSELFMEIRKKFSFSIDWVNLLSTIEGSIMGQFGWKRVEEERQKQTIGHAILAAMHYEHSPEAADQFVLKHNGDATDIDWSAEIRKASQKIANNK